ncbi:poly [ADP-ribose] polymerase tankyrase-1 isoform X1 [Tachysurus ichikawai]
MATSRRASQQQHQNLSSPPRIASTSLTPPGSPPGAGVLNISPPAGGEPDGAGDADPSAASSPTPLRSASSTSSSSTSTSSASSPSTTGGSSPGSASTSPGGGCASSGAFRELFEACRNGDVSRVKRLVDSVNVNSKDMAGRKSTPLHFAAGFGRKDVVEHLLQTGANVHARDDGGLIPLHNACSFGHAEVVSLLLCQGADPNARDNWNYTPLHEAAIKGKIDVCIVSPPVSSPDKSSLLRAAGGDLKLGRCLLLVFSLKMDECDGDHGGVFVEGRVRAVNCPCDERLRQRRP